MVTDPNIHTPFFMQLSVDMYIGSILCVGVIMYILLPLLPPSLTTTTTITYYYYYHHYYYYQYCPLLQSFLHFLSFLIFLLKGRNSSIFLNIYGLFLFLIIKLNIQLYALFKHFFFTLIFSPFSFISVHNVFIYIYKQITA